jgi:hypothetical protein
MEGDMGLPSHDDRKVSPRPSAIRWTRHSLGLRSLAIATLLVLFILVVRAGDKKVNVSKIHGRIQYVKSFPDYKVKAVTSFPDLRVQVVESFPSSPGQWQIVDSFPDYKIEMVDSFPDFTVQFVSSFPGPPK